MMANEAISISSSSTDLHASTNAADLRVQRSRDRVWEISALTPRALYWVQANFADHFPETEEDVIRTNLSGANMLMGKARLAGFLTEYVGPNATSYF